MNSLSFDLMVESHDASCTFDAACFSVAAWIAIPLWRHIGKEGTVYFPRAWLDAAPRSFCGMQVFTAGIELAYNHACVHAHRWASRLKER